MSNLPNQPDQPDVFGADHPIIITAVAWLENTDTVPLTRAAAENLLPHWDYYLQLTERERAGILNRFPVSVPSGDVDDYRKRLDAHTAKERLWLDGLHDDA